MKRPLHFWLLFLATALILRHAAATSTPADTSPFIIDSWNTDDRLPQNTVAAITQTHDGYFWLGTLNGLARFDGNSLTPFNVANTPGLPGIEIVYLFEDSQANLWVGFSGGGLCRIQNGIVYPLDTGSLNSDITVAYEIGGDVWFVTGNRRFLCWHNGALLPEAVANQQLVANPDLARFLTVLGYHVYVSGKNGSSWQFWRGRIEKWTSTNTLDATYKPIRCPWGDTTVTASCEDEAGNLIVGTRGAGVFWFDAQGGYRRIFAEEDTATRNYVLSLFFDHEGNLWVGTDGGGLNRVQRRIFRKPEGLPGGVAWSAAEDNQAGLWVSFNFHGLAYWRTNSTLDYRIGSLSLPGPVFVDSRSNVWTGTSGEGLFLFNSQAGNFSPVVQASPLGSQVYSLFQSRNRDLWAGGSGTLAQYDGQNWRVFSTVDGLPPGAVRAIAEDNKGLLWIGTAKNGLYTVQAGKISSTNSPVKDIASLLIDRDGVLWVGTIAHGLAEFQNGTWKTFTEKDGLVNDVGYLLEDESGNLWLGSYEGLMRVSKKSLAEFDVNQSVSGQRLSSRMYLTTECSLGVQPAAIHTRDDRLLFPTTDGLLSLNPAELKRNTNPPPVVIESVLVDGIQQRTNALASGWPGGVTLTPADEQLEVHFTALDFSAPKGARQSVRFRYKLVNYDSHWTDAGGERVIRFPKLPPDNYTLQTQACNEDGVWNETGASLAIAVEPPFWRTTGFIVTSVLISLGILAGVIYLVSTAKLRRQLRALHQKEMIERERARIARDLHDQLGANLTQVTLLGEMAAADKDLPAEVEDHAQQICETARETTRSLDEIVWAVNPANDTLEGLTNYACKYAQDYFALAKLRYRADLPAKLPDTPIPPEVRHNVFLAFKESVNNVVKHAQATEARVRLTVEPDRFIFTIEDNGRGLGDLSGKQLRNGLKNMRRRLSDVRGEFDIGPGPNGGTIVQLKVPITPPKS